MSAGVQYADTSALVRAYVSDEEDHERLRMMLLEGDRPVVSSELTRLEFASAVTTAGRVGRLRRPRVLLDRFDRDCRDDGPLTLLTLDPPAILPVARQLVREHPIRTLDALHLAVALTVGKELAAGEPVAIVTRDRAQAAAAAAVGLEVA